MILKALLKVAKNLLHVENVPIVGDIVEEINSEDGGKGQFQQVNTIRLIRKIARIALIALATYFIIKGDDEKAEKIEKQYKKIEYVETMD